VSAYVAAGAGLAVAVANGVIITRYGLVGTGASLVVMTAVGYGFGVWDGHAGRRGALVVTWACRVITWAREAAGDLRRAFTGRGGAHEEG
jgi:hypothetical protein